jgi:hypothetical protein
LKGFFDLKKTSLMTHRIFISLSIITFFLVCINFLSCSKPDAVTPTDPCAGKTILLTATTTATSGGSTANGSITATASGSTGFTYSLNGGAFQGSGTFSNLAVGAYSVVAKDASGCTGTQSFTVTATACPTITITAIITPASTATNGAINATATGSTGITYSIDAGPFQATGVFSGLTPASHNITAKDVNGCTATSTFLVTSVGCPTITVSSTTTNTAGPTGTTGSITATATGGATPYLYSLNGVAFQTSNLFSNLAAATNYTVVAKDANNCQGSAINITVASNPCPTINFTQAVTGSDKCATIGTGTINVTATGSTGFTYSKDGVTFQASNVFTALLPTNYTITVKDLNGCVKTGIVTVNQATAGPLFTNVKTIMTANCALSGCHAGASPQNGINFSDDCTIVAQKTRIKIRAVDGNPSIMPPSGSISAADKQKIVDWINGGGQHSN